MPIARTCANILILCQDYLDLLQFYESLDECIYNSEGFSESAYNGIHSLIITSIQDVQDISNYQLEDTSIQDVQDTSNNRLETRTTIDESVEVIDLTNGDDDIYIKKEQEENNEPIHEHVIIDLENEAYLMENSSRPKRRSTRTRKAKNSTATGSSSNSPNIIQRPVSSEAINQEARRRPGSKSKSSKKSNNSRKRK